MEKKRVTDSVSINIGIRKFITNTLYEKCQTMQLLYEIKYSFK